MPQKNLDIPTEITDKELNSEEKETAELFIYFLRVISKLRDPESGCPWDKEQTHQSLRSYLLEESYETVEAIDLNVPDKISEELGDVLLQIALHSQIASENKHFSFNEVLSKITEKMITRHPHVFGDLDLKDSNEVIKNWDKIKNQEKNNSKNNLSSKLKKLPKDLPQLIRAQRIGEKSSNWGFDWLDLSGILDKVKEEFNELSFETAKIDQISHDTLKPLTDISNNQISTEQKQRIGEEIGDCLFSLVQLGRWLGLSAEDLLRQTHSRFIERISFMEEELDTNLKSTSRNSIEDAWDNAKTRQKK